MGQASLNLMLFCTKNLNNQIDLNLYVLSIWEVNEPLVAWISMAWNKMQNLEVFRCNLDAYIYISSAWSTNLVSTCCPNVTKGHKWHIYYLSVMPFCHGGSMYLPSLCSKPSVHHNTNVSATGNLSYQTSK